MVCVLTQWKCLGDVAAACMVLAWNRLECHPPGLGSLIRTLRHRHYHQNMTWATRVALWSATLVIAYILALFQFILQMAAKERGKRGCQ